DLILRRARLRRTAQVRDIGITNGRIVAIEPTLDTSAAERIDLDGRLVLPGLVNVHLHLDKVLFGERTGQDQAGSVEEGFRRTWAFKREYTVEDVRDRALRVLRAALTNGTLALRMFADVDTYAELRALRGLIAAREKFGAFITLQLVAFPQEGIFSHPGTESLMQQAMDLGADVVGGLPWVEATQDEQYQHIDFVFQLA